VQIFRKIDGFRVFFFEQILGGQNVLFSIFLGGFSVELQFFGISDINSDNWKHVKNRTPLKKGWRTKNPSICLWPQKTWNNVKHFNLNLHSCPPYTNLPFRRKNTPSFKQLRSHFPSERKASHNCINAGPSASDSSFRRSWSMGFNIPTPLNWLHPGSQRPLNFKLSLGTVDEVRKSLLKHTP